MIKKQNNLSTQALYVAPECSVFSISAESAIAVSGTGKIDDGTGSDWGTLSVDPSDLTGIDQLLPGIDNNLLF